MTTALQFVTWSLRDIGAVALNEQPTDDEANDGLEQLNEMIDSWSNESMTVFAFQEQALPMVPGQNQYTIGPGGDLLNETAAALSRPEATYIAFAGKRREETQNWPAGRYEGRVELVRGGGVIASTVVNFDMK